MFLFSNETLTSSHLTQHSMLRFSASSLCRKQSIKIKMFLLLTNIFHLFFLKQEKPEEFVNVNRLAIIKKIIRPISEQEENESRKLWKEVTRALKFNDIDKATNAKFQLEQKQREEARERKLTNTEWETKVSCYRIMCSFLN